MHSEITGHPRRGELQLAISNAVVHALRQAVGRGPTKAKTTVADDLVVVTMRDALTRTERSLVERGEIETVLDQRRAIQRALRQDFSDSIEELTGRKVRAFMSDYHVDPDVAVEIFLLDSPAIEDDVGA